MTPSRRALITGIGGQDGSYLSELLLEQGYAVVGVVRRPVDDHPALAGVRDRVRIVEADLLDSSSLVPALRDVAPHEVFNLAAPSFVPRSWDEPVRTAEFAAVGVTSLLEAIAGLRPKATGRIWIRGEAVMDTGAGLFLPPERRRIGYVPQDACLFPHLDVEGNVRFGMSRAGRGTLFGEAGQVLKRGHELAGVDARLTHERTQRLRNRTCRRRLIRAALGGGLGCGCLDRKSVV